MNRSRSRSILIAALLLAAFAIPLSAQELPSDDRLLHGQLDNGVRWIYRQHDNPPGKMALQMHVRTGSLNETDDQRGLAHFLEHMCFNGSENFPPGTLVPYFESIGMQFGPHLNAFTSFDQTVYMLFTPNTETEQLDKALMVLSDYAFRVTLPAEEIDKERGVVLEESRSGKGAQQRIRDELWPDLFADTRFAARLPIGEDDILANAPRSEFLDYYRAWYRPDNITVVLVGDADPEPILPLIEKWFGEYEAGQPARDPKGPEFKPFTGERAFVVTDPEMPYCEVELLNIYPGRPPATTEAQWRTELVESIGAWIVGRRYDDRVKKGEASYRQAYAGVSDFFHDAVLVYGGASGEPQDWETMLTELITEVKRAREHGFTERELDLARRQLLAAAERALRTEPTLNAQSIISQIVASVNDRTPLLSAQTSLNLFEEHLPGVTLDEVNRAFKEHFMPGTFAHIVTLVEKEGVPVPTRDDVLAGARKAWDREVEPLPDSDAAAELLEELPEPGKFVEQSKDEELGVTSAWLDNGVRMHHRFMDYKKDSVYVSISLAGGNIEETADNAGITQVATLAVNEAATSRLSSSEMRDLMTGKNINVGAAPAGDSLMITVSGSPLDLEAGLQKAHALILDGHIEESAFRNWKLQILQQLEERETLPHFKAYEAVEQILSNNDPRRVPFRKENVEALTREAAQAWYDRLRAKAPIEVAVVGDVPADRAMELVARYLGSLPERPRGAAHLKPLRESKREDGPHTRSVEVSTVTPQAVAIAGFAGVEGRNTREARALQLAEQILSSRLIKRVREDLSIVYSIFARNDPSWIYEDAGRFQAGAPCDPGNARRVIDEVHNLYTEFAENGPTDEELANAKKQVANLLDTSMREPTYWWSILRNRDLHGRDLDAEKSILEDYEKLTAEAVREAFGKYYTAARKYSVIATPVAAGEEENEE